MTPACPRARPPRRRPTASAASPVLCVLLCVLALAPGATAANIFPTARDQSFTLSAGTSQALRLEGNFEVPDGGELTMPIEVRPPHFLAINGSAPPSIVSVNSSTPDGTYLPGDEIELEVAFTKAVNVSGTPRLRLQTGCHEDACEQKEVQILTCGARTGSFAVEFDGDVVSNIRAEADQEEVKYRLEELDSVQEVTVAFSDGDDEEYSGGRRACTTNGNNITVTFERHSVEDVDGDLPLMNPDRWNAFLNPRTQKSVGDGSYLTQGSGAFITAYELVAGNRWDDRYATYTGHKNPTTLLFRYEVAYGDYAETDLVLPEPIELSADDGDAITDASTGEAASLTVPEAGAWASSRTGALDSLSASTSIAVRGRDVPQVLYVTSSHDEESVGFGMDLVVLVVFSHPVTVGVNGSAPRLLMDVSQWGRYAEYDELRSSNDTLAFVFTTGPSDETNAKLVEYSGRNALELNGGTIRLTSTNPVVDAHLLLPEPGSLDSLSERNGMTIEFDTPWVNNVTLSSSTSDVYRQGDAILVDVEFSHRVSLGGDAHLLLTMDRLEAAPAVYDATHRGFTAKLPTGSWLDPDGAVGHQYEIAGQRLTVASVSDGTVTFEERYTGPTVNQSSPALPFYVPAVRQAHYHSGNGTDTLTFSYEIYELDFNAHLAYNGTDSLVVSEGGWLRRWSSRPATPVDATLPGLNRPRSLGYKYDIVVDSTVPTVLAVNSTKLDGTYGVGERIDFVVAFTHPVVVTGTLALFLDLAPEVHQAAIYTRGSGSQTLHFEYTVQEGDTADRLAYAHTRALSLTYGHLEGTLKHATSNPTANVNRTLPYPGAPSSFSALHNLAIDTGAPYVQEVRVGVADGTYGAGAELPIVVAFSAPVLLVGAGSLLVDTLPTATQVFYSTGNGTAELTFNYTVLAGDGTDGGPLALVLGSADVTNTTRIDGDVRAADEPLRQAVAQLPAPQIEAQVVIDTASPPTVESVTTDTPDGLYGEGAAMTLAVLFSEPVVAGGTLRLLLELGGDDAKAEYWTGSGTDTLLFNFTVRAGHSTSDLDYASAASLTGGSVKQRTTTPTTDADLTLPEPGTPGSLGFASNIVVDTQPPYVVLVTTTAAAGQYGVLQSTYTIDIYDDDAAIVEGSYQLEYRGERTGCIEWDASAANVTAEIEALSDLELNVTVLLDADAFPFGRRYEVTFDTPARGTAPLSVEADDGTCNQAGPTPVLSPAALEPGFVDVVVRFSDFVEADTSAGTPTLRLDTGAPAELVAAPTVQIIDVGVDASEAVSAGQFRLSYGGELTTGCINWYSADGDSDYSMRSRLLELAPVKTLGLASVERVENGGGSTFTVTFARGEPLQLLPFADNSACTALEPSDAEVRLGGNTDLTFRYTIAEGDASAALTAEALYLNGSAVVRRDTLTSADLSLPSSAASSPLEVSIYTAAGPFVVNVTSDTPSRPYGYGVGQLINVLVTFSEDVQVNGDDPELIMFDGYVAQFTGGSRTLGFTYVAGADSQTDDLSVFRAETSLRGGSLTAVDGGAAANATLPYPLGLGLVINTTAPVVVGVDSTLANETILREGDYMDIFVTFSDVVAVTGSPRLVLNSQSAATYFRGGDVQLIDVLGAGDDDEFALEYDGQRTACAVWHNMTDVDVEGVASVEATALDGGGVRYTVTFVADSTPSALLPASGFTGCRGSVAVERPATTKVWFRFVAPADEDIYSLTYTSRNALELNGGTIKRHSSRPTTAANVTLPREPWPQMHYRLDSSAPRVVDVSALVSDGSLGEGALFDLEVTWDFKVMVEGDVRLALNTGRHAAYVNGSGSAVLLFRYTVAEGDSSAALDYQGRDSLEVTSSDGWIRAWSPAPLTAANLTLPTPGARGSISDDQAIVIDDELAGRIVEVSSSHADDSYGVGEEIPISVTFNKKVFIEGDDAPSLLLDPQGTAHYTGGDGSHTLDFLYTVLAGQNTSDLGAAAFNMSRGYMRDRYGVVANTTMYPGGHDRRSLAHNAAIRVDTTQPYVRRVEGVSDDGVFGVGDDILMDVVFSAPVTVTATPELRLDVGDGVAKEAVYVSGSGTKSLRFAYAVETNDYTYHLDYWDINSLLLDEDEGASIVRTSTTPTTAAVTVLPHLNGDGALSANSVYIIDGAAPAVVSVTSSLANGTVLTTGDVLDLTVTFSLPVVALITPPSLRLSTGADGRVGVAEYSSGSGSYAFVFLYTVVSGDSISAVDYEDTYTTAYSASVSFPLDISKGALFHDTTVPTTMAYLGFPRPGFSSHTTITLDTAAPTVTKVQALNPDGVYGVDTLLQINVVFSLPVTVTGTPYLRLELRDDQDDPYAAYVSGDGTDTLLFEYTTADGDNSAALDFVDEGSLRLTRDWEWVLTTPAATITRLSNASTELANLALPPPGAPLTVIAPLSIVGSGSAIVIDARARIPQRIYSTLAAATYGAGQHVPIVVKFSHEVYADDTVQLQLAVGERVVELNHTAGGNGTRFVRFSYVVEEGDSSAGAAIDYDGLYALSVLSGSVRAVSDDFPTPLLLPAAGSDASLSSSGIVIDSAAPVVESVTTPAGQGTVGAGQEVYLSVHFSAPVYVSGSPNLTLATSPARAQAPYLNGSGTAELVFLYTVSAGEMSEALEYYRTTALQLNGGSIVRVATVPTTAANLTLPLPSSQPLNVAVDTAVPEVLSVQTDVAAGTYGVGDEVDMVVTLSLPVVVVGSGSPLLRLKPGRNATFVSGSGSDALLFRYLVESGDHVSDLDYTTADALHLNGSEILRVATVAQTAADLTLPPPGAVSSLGRGSSLVIDTTAPTVVSVAPQLAAGTYGTGQVVLVEVTFSEAVTADGAGSSSLALNTGASAALSHGQGSETLVFAYTVRAGDSAPSGLEVSGERALAGATIRSASTGAFAVRRLDYDSGMSTLSQLVIDTSAPTVTRVWTDTAFNEFGYGVGHEIVVLVQFSVPVELFGSATLTLDVESERDADYTSGSTTDTLSFLYTVQEGDSARLLATLDTAALSGDIRLNSTASTTAVDPLLPEEGEPGSLSATSRVAIDTTPPVVEGIVSYTSEGEYGGGQTIDIAVRFNVPVSVSGEPLLLMNTGGYAVYDASFLAPRPESDGRQISFLYEVQESDLVTDLRPVALDLQNGSAAIRRWSTTPTRDADLTLADDVWAMDRIRSAEVLVRGLHHEWASDVSVTVAGKGQSVLVLDQEGGSHSLGRPHDAEFPRIDGVLDADARLHGVGHDYLFADGLDENLALRGLATQSSTAHGALAARAIDGSVDGHFSSGSVTHTGMVNVDRSEAWWQVELEASSEIGTIVLWNREQEPNVDEVQTLWLESYWDDLGGTFSLNVTVGGVLGTTEPIQFDAPAMIADEAAEEPGESVQSKLQALPNVGAINVRRRAATDTSHYHTYSWTVTFVGELEDVAQMTADTSALTALSAERIAFVARTEQEGDGNQWYAYQEPLATLSQRLFPCYVMVHAQVGKYASLEAALDAAVWSELVTAEARETTLNVPANTTGLTVRVQLLDDDPLTLAEVQVFADARHKLDSFGGGRAVSATPASRPFSSRQSLNKAFVGERMNGTWALRVRDHVERPEADVNAWPGLVAQGDVLRRNGRGALSDWVLLLTDETNVVRHFYPRITGHVVDLPKYGLVLGGDGAAVPADAERANVPLRCLGVDTTGANGERSGVAGPRDCGDNFGVHRSLSTRRFGSPAAANNHHEERLVSYEPLAGFTGPDYFSYALSAPGGLVSDAAIARFDVRDCRARTVVPTQHLLCSCESSSVPANSTLCLASLEAACLGALAEPGEVGEGDWRPLCLACAPSSVDAFDELTGQCLVQLQRAHAVVTAYGWCDTEEKPACEPESFGSPPREPLVSYASPSRK